jgi:serine/threonine protein kinase
MIIFAAPTTTVATPPYPTEPATTAVRNPRHRFATVHTLDPSGRGEPDQPQTTQCLPPERDTPPADDPDRALLSSQTVSRSAVPESTMDIWPLQASDPVRVGDYRLVSRLGTGGSADVYYAVARKGQPVAVKLLREADGSRKACRREYRLAHTMDADCTAPALAHGMSAAGAYLVTAYLPGYRCADTLLNRQMSTGQLWTLGAALARVLAAIHARGIVHCDVKPANLLVRADQVRVIDFGIARYVGERYVGGIVQYTRGWAAPEQLRAAPATPAVDVFAWGCLLAHLASGVHPFAGQNEREWILCIQATEPDLFGLPPDLDELIRWTLARNPQDRPSTPELATICQARCDQRSRPEPRPRLEAADREHLAREHSRARDNDPFGPNVPGATRLAGTGMRRQRLAA